MREQETSERQNLMIEAEGARLAACYYPPTGARRANLAIHAATGVPQRYYEPFATWASQQGVGVLTYDYRDFGASLEKPMRQSNATFTDWAIKDQAAAERTLSQLAPEGPLWLLGHSLGGLTFAFRPQDARVEQVTTIGAGFAHVSDHPWHFLPMALAFWYGIGPAATLIAGYMPGKRLMLGADLPAGVYWQWRRWCVRREFFRSDMSLPKADFQAKRPPIRILTSEDDAMVPPVAVRRHFEAFPPGQAEFRILTPAEFGLPSLRHIEVFAKRNAAAWPAILGRPAASNNVPSVSRVAPVATS